MRRLFSVLLLSTICLSGYSQKWQIETMGGFSGYAGDLTEPELSFKSLGPGVNLNVKYMQNSRLLFRGGIGWGTISAYDRNNKDASLKNRNLNFKSNILEANACLEVNIFDPFEPYELKIYPYFFAGIGVFHFDPFSYDSAGTKVFLKPLSTEGQGFPEFPDRKEYNLIQFCIPFGLGVKLRLGKRIDTGVEFGFRKTFTDYLDDVSSTYVDKDALLGRKGPKAVEMAYRSLDSKAFPNDARGNPKRKDYYYMMGLKMTIKLGKIKKASEQE